MRILNSPAAGPLNRRAQLLLLLAYVICALVMTFPLGLQLASSAPSGSDPLKHIWRLAWEGHQLFNSPLALFRANSFYAYPDSFAFDDLMLTQGLFTLPVLVVTDNAALAHNLVILTSFVLSGYTMFLFGFHLTRNRSAAWLAGLIFAFSTFRMAHLPHMNLLMVQWIPLFFLGLDKMLYTSRLRVAVMTAIACVLQGLASLMVFYLLFLAAVPYVLAAVLWRRLFRVSRLIAIGVMGLVSGILVIVFAIPYAHLASSQDFVRDDATVQALAATLTSYLAVPPENWLWGHVLAVFQPIGNYPAEHWLFLGATACLLAIIGALHARTSIAARLLCVVGLVAFILSFGPTFYISATQKLPLPFSLPYSWLYHVLPGFSSLRAGSRFAIIVSFACAGLAAIGAAALAKRINLQWQWGFVSLLTVLILMENIVLPVSLLAIPSRNQVSRVYHWLATQPAGTAIAELPIGGKRSSVFSLGFYQYASTFHWQPILTSAYFSYVPKDYGTLLGFTSLFPSTDSIRLLNEFQVKEIVVHYSDYKAADRTAEEKALAASGLKPIVEFGPDMVYPVPTQEQDMGELGVTAYVPAVPLNEKSLSLYLLVTNATSHLYFFNPSRKLEIEVNGQPISLALPFLLEPGTTILLTQIPNAPDTLQVNTTPDSTISMPPQRIQVEHNPETPGGRPVAIQFVSGKMKHPTKDSSAIQLEWQVRDRIRVPYLVHVNLYDSNAKLVAETETRHDAPASLTARWRAGETLQDTIKVPPAAASSAVSIEILLFEQGSGSRLIPLDTHDTPIKELRLPIP